MVAPIMLHFSSPFSNMAGASEYWKPRDNTTASMSRRTDLRLPVVCGDVDPRHALHIEEAELHAQYVTDKETAEDIALPILLLSVTSLIVLLFVAEARLALA